MCVRWVCLGKKSTVGIRDSLGYFHLTWEFKLRIHPVHMSAQLISAFVFTTMIVQSLYFLNLKLFSGAVRSGLFRTSLETPKTAFVMMGLK